MGQAAVPATEGADVTDAAVTEEGAGVDGFPVTNLLSSNLPNRVVVLP